MTNQPGTQPEEPGPPAPAPDPASPTVGRPDSRRVWLDRTDALFGDVPGAPKQPPPAPRPGSAGPEATEYGAQPRAARAASPSVSWPTIDASTTGLERPNWEQWRQAQGPHDPVQPPPATPGPREAVGPTEPSRARKAALASRRLGGPGWVPVVVTAGVMLMSFGLRPSGMYPGHYHGPPGSYGMNQMGDTGPPLQGVTTVTPIGGEVPAVTNPARVRLEVLAPTGTTATVTYASDGQGVQTEKDVAVPWAVEAPLSVDNSVIQLSAAQAKVGSAASAAFTCRIYLDDKVVVDSRSRGSISCATNVGRFRAQPQPGIGTPLAPALHVEPLGTVQRALPSPSPGKASTVTFEAYSADQADTADVSFGPPNTRTKERRWGQRMPSAWQATLSPQAGLVSVSVRDTIGSPALVMCRILLDGVVVTQIVAPGTASCTTSVGDVLAT